MIKIVNDINIVTALNNAVSALENNPSSKYCDILKHGAKNLWAVPIMPDYLRKLSGACPFITEDWLTTGLVEELPSDWKWLYPERHIRLIMDADLLSDIDIKLLIMTVILGDIPYIVEGSKVYIYLEEIFPEQSILLSQEKYIGKITREEI